jgi:chromosome segregation ATPase
MQREYDLFLLAKLGQHDLLNEIVSIQQRYDNIMSNHSQTQIAELEDKLDALVIKTREVRANLSKLENEALESARQHANAESVLRNIEGQYSTAIYQKNTSRALLTRAEVAERDNQLASLQQRMNRAAITESEALTAYRAATGRVNDAVAELKAADAAARDAKQQLDVLKGRTGGYGSSGLSAA